MAKGYFRIWPLDDKGMPLGDTAAKPNPYDEKAFDLYFGVPDASQIAPKEQLELQVDIEKVLRAVQQLYRAQPGFRLYYVRLFALAQLGLEGENTSTDLARSALQSVSAEIVDDKAGNVKNSHLKTLGGYALAYSALLAGGYAALKWCDLPTGALVCLGIEHDTLANFLMLWIGSALGVWLSYAIRTTTFTLSDLLITDSDRLLPSIRLIYAGCLSMLIGLILVLGIADIKLGNVPLSQIATRPMLAFLVGAFCGVSELTLPTAVARRASDFVSSLK